MSALPGLVLAIDTSSPEGSVALGDRDGPRSERGWTVTTTISQELLAEVDALLTEAAVQPADLTGIAICVGPGGYGGLRAGIATAQGMALALDVPLAAVSRLEADAAPHLEAAPAGRPVVAIHDAGRSGLAWAAYACPAQAQLPAELVSPSMSTLEECVARAPAGAIWCGEISEALATALAARAGDGYTIAERASTPRAVSVLELARKRDNYDDPALADAVYLRPPAITPPKTPPAR